MTTQLETRFGLIDVTVQDAATAYVRIATGDRGDTTTEPLQLPRGAAAYGRAHFKLDAEQGWKPHRGYDRLYRSGGGDLTPTMQAAAADAISEALDLHISTDALEDAQYAKNAEQAAERREQAEGLMAMAGQLNRQATELEMDRGARVVYLEQQLRSGTQQQATAVRTSNGELLFIDEPRPYNPFLAHDGRGMRRFKDEPAAWVERD